MSYLFRVIIVIKFLLLFLLAVLCSRSLAAPDKQLLRKLDLQRGLFSDTYQSFDIDGRPVIYVLQENTTAITRGVAVMIADSGVPIMGQEGFAALANEFNKIGWVTILLPAPEIGFRPNIEQASLIIEDTGTTPEAQTNAATDMQVPSASAPIAD